MARAVAQSGLALLLLLAGCGSTSAPVPDHPGNVTPADASSAPLVDAGLALDRDTGSQASADGAGDGSASIPADRFITGVVSFDPGGCAGYGASSLPTVVEGPPVGGGTARGSTDVVSLGGGGSIVVSFAPDEIVDGPGADFIVFENPFWIAGNSSNVYAEPGEVSVSEDGITWQTFPCAPASAPLTEYGGTGVAPPYGQCAGWHVVYSSPDNGISPFDPSMAGGDPFDLASLGVARARYVRIVDKTNEACDDGGSNPGTNGFDLDAIAIVNAASP